MPDNESISRDLTIIYLQNKCLVQSLHILHIYI
ncbi:hypothetical protein J2S18_001990 [Eubacterium multiforme]|uniref:Uncharacterized protein n=1 Tax=Eubacterium multiforme TaxID=83339 RepID=A0ABT9UUU6_9FIRM|nr:hypothetical protein [Eubacterium multiforme]